MKTNIKTLQEIAMLATLQTGRWSARKIDRDVTSETIARYGSEDTAGVFSKDLVARESFKEINIIISRARAYHRKKTVPWMFDGTGLLTVASYDEYRTTMDQFIRDCEDAVENFMEYYVGDLLISEQKRLNGMYNPNDYPSPEDVRASFYMKVVYAPISNPDDIRVAAQGAAKEALEKMVLESHENAIAEVSQTIFRRLFKVVNKMAETLSKDKRIYSSVVTNIQDLLVMSREYTPFLDPSTKDLLDQIEGALTVTSADELRGNETKRHEIADKAKEVSEKLTAYF